MYSDKEYLILEHINDTSVPTRQRDLAAAADLSLGMTNAVLKKLVIKGLLVMKRVNSRNIHYALTPEGLSEIARRSRALLKRTLSSVASYRNAAEHYIADLKNKGIKAVNLQGPSDLDFIIEWACMKQGLNFRCLNPGTAKPSVEAGIITINEQELFNRLDAYLIN